MGTEGARRRMPLNLSGKRTEWRSADKGLRISVYFLFRSSWQQLFRLFLGGNKHVSKSGSNPVSDCM